VRNAANFFGVDTMMLENGNICKDRMREKVFLQQENKLGDNEKIKGDYAVQV